ncbi:MAG: glycosyltransferase family 39 protein [Nitrospirae bacterium]|nr:glycosyltransferase family 39 protein [Nitrospirota bacterium]
MDNYYPPLATLATSVFYFFLPPDIDTATWILNQLFLGLLMLAVYRLGTHLYSPEIGLLAAVAVTSFPIIIDQSRIFMLDIPTTAMTAWARTDLRACDPHQMVLSFFYFSAPDLSGCPGPPC